MSKERFEEFGTKDYLAIKDNEEIPHLLNQYQCVVRLNEFVDKIKKLENELIGRKKLCDLRYEQLKHAHQDKIKFAVDCLNKLKDFISNYYNIDCDYQAAYSNKIDEMIIGVLDE